MKPNPPPCPDCHTGHVTKNGFNRQRKQQYLCHDCGRQFITDYNSHLGYSDEFRRECLRMYVNGSGFRAIERVKKVHHTTVMHWVKQVGELLPNAYEPEQTPDVGEFDELQTYIGSKTTSSGSGLSSTTFDPVFSTGR